MNHPLKKYDYAILKKNLMERVASGLLEHKVEGDLELFDYSRDCTFGKHWDDFTLSARGVVLCNSTQSILGYCLPKFFNLGEQGYSLAELPNEPYEVFNKADGSLAIAYTYEGKWKVNTRGSFTSDQAIWATNWLNDNKVPIEIGQDRTLLFEIIYPENRIVVDYKGWSGLILLAWYQDGTERPVDTLAGELAGTPIRIVERFEHLEIPQLIELCEKHLDHNNEGFVVRFASGTRIKIKSAQYCRIHKLMSKITPLGVWEYIHSKSNVKPEDYCKELPEEFQLEFMDIWRILINRFQNLNDKSIKYFNRCKATNRKDFAQEVLTKVPVAFHSLIFLRYDNKIDHLRDSIIKRIRPDGNQLLGYTPRSVTNRFAESNDT